MTNSRDDAVVITGVGPVTSIGVGAEALWTSLVAGRSNVVKRAVPVDLGIQAELPIASMPAPDEVPGLGAHLAFLDTQDVGDYRDLAYALLAMELALSDAGLTYDREANRIGMIQAFEAPGVEATATRLFMMFQQPIGG